MHTSAGPHTCGAATKFLRVACARSWGAPRTVSPALPDSDEVFFQPHNAEFLLRFPPVTTTAIRIIGNDKVQDHWHKYTKNVSSFISITELQVYEAR